MNSSSVFLFDHIENAADRTELLRVDAAQREIDVVAGLEIGHDLQIASESISPEVTRRSLSLRLPIGRPAF